jgi:hypothetical protein
MLAPCLRTSKTNMIHVIDEPGTWEADVLPAAPPAARPATRNPMLLHYGGQVIERDALFGIETPHPAETWFPLPHRYLVEEVESLPARGAGFFLPISGMALSVEAKAGDKIVRGGF